MTEITEDMQVDANPAVSRKRKYVLPDGSDDKGSSNQNIKRVETHKVKAHSYVRDLYMRICSAFKIGDMSSDLIVSDYMINQAASVHNCMRSNALSEETSAKMTKFERETTTTYNR